MSLVALGTFAAAALGGTKSVLGWLKQRDSDLTTLENNIKMTEFNESVAKENFLLDKGEAYQSWDIFSDNTNKSIAQTAKNQKLNALTSSYSLYANDKADFRALSDTIMSAQASKGNARANAARTGLRNEGSVARVIEQTDKTADRAVETAKENALIGSNMRFLSARQSFLDSETQKEVYQDSIRQQYAVYKSSLDRLSKNYETTMEQYRVQKEEYRKQLDDLNDPWNATLSLFGSVATDIFSFGASAYGLFK